MGVLSKDTIEGLMRKPISDADSLVITPMLSDDAFDQDSVDLRLGTHFLLPQIPPQPFTDQGNDHGEAGYMEIHTPLGSYFVLPAHQAVLGSTLEFIKLPYNVSGEILTKSSVARTFMVIETAPWIHPSYRGCLTLEIANVSNTAILLYPGMRIGQLVLLETDIDKPEEKLSGSYLGPINPEGPKLKSSTESLTALGVTKHRRPGHGWISHVKMRQEMEAEIAKLSQDEKLKIKSLLEIARRNGAFPTEMDIHRYLPTI